MLATRSLSLTRSSAASANVVVPSAAAAATASTGISSISDGHLRAAHLGGVQRAVAGPMTLAGRVRGRLVDLDGRAHAPEHVEEAGPARARRRRARRSGRCRG